LCCGPFSSIHAIVNPPNSAGAIVGVALELGRQAQERVGTDLDVAGKQALRCQQARNDRGAGRSHAPPVWNRVVRLEADAGHLTADGLEGVRHRAHDEV
jgi:hypothetical protein